jgi:hypothetical protein
MHDNTAEHWHETTGNTKKAGLGPFKRVPMAYDRFMEEQEIPIFRGIGVGKVQNLPLAPWKRMGGRGSFIQLYGTEAMWGSYIVEVPGAGALTAEKHLYEEVYLVIGPRHDGSLARRRRTRPHIFAITPDDAISIRIVEA